MNKIPINPSVLVWARESSGFSLEDMTKNKSFSKLQRWELGEDEPTYSQLEKLAEKYRRPLAVFFFPSPPQEETIEKSLRANFEEDLQVINPVVRWLFRKAKFFQLSLKELLAEEQELQKQKISWMEDLGDLPTQELAIAVRNRLGISLEQQESWKDSDEALSVWREVLAENGIFVFKDAFRTADVSGFCIYDEIYPLIYVNNSHSKNRQIFTIFHEIAHLIFKQSYLDFISEEIKSIKQLSLDNEESRCNAFAAEFLVPSPDFKSKAQDCDCNDSKNIYNFSKKYHVSQEVILRKMLEQELISLRSYRKKFQEINKASEDARKMQKKGGGNYYNTKASYLGYSYISIVLKRFYQDRISVDQASEYLDIKPKSFSHIEKLFLGL